MAAQARLFCKTGPLAGTSFSISGEATVGKSPGNTIQLTANIISGKHARIVFDEKRSEFFIEDLGSTNGTWVDGIKVAQKERLGALSIVSFANAFDFVFQTVSKNESSETKELPKPEVKKQSESQQPPTGKSKATLFDDGTPAVPPMRPPRQPPKQEPIVPQEPPASRPEQRTVIDDGGLVQVPSPGGARPVQPNKGATVFDDGRAAFSGPSTPQIIPKQYILEVKSPAGLKTFEMKEGDNIIGREKSCSIWIEDSSISRQHAIITLKSGSLTISDPGSKNGTFCNGRRVSTGETLRSGDELQFGNIAARLIS